MSQSSKSIDYETYNPTYIDGHPVYDPNNKYKGNATQPDDDLSLLYSDSSRSNSSTRRSRSRSRSNSGTRKVNKSRSRIASRSVSRARSRSIN